MAGSTGQDARFYGKRDACRYRPAFVTYASHMDADERDIYQYMKHHGREFIPALEVCRRVGGKRRFRNNHDWARPVLARMVERGILESDPEGRIRLKPMPKQEPTGKKWASQEIVK